jgi:hypothetical protein
MFENETCPKCGKEMNMLNICKNKKCSEFGIVQILKPIKAHNPDEKKTFDELYHIDEDEIDYDEEYE